MNDAVLLVMRKLEDLSGGGGRKFWNIPRESGNFLSMMVRVAQARAVLEIGTSNGYSGLWLAESLSHTGGKLYTVESHKERFQLARENFAEAGLQNFIEQIYGHAPEVFGTDVFTGRDLRFDLIFFDATKMEYVSYLKAVLPMLKVNGLLIADNVVSHAEAAGDFLAAVRGNAELQSEVLPLGGGLMVAVRGAGYEWAGEGAGIWAAKNAPNFVSRRQRWGCSSKVTPKTNPYLGHVYGLG
jgi:predicted O-methyltransferase YrrM